MTLPPLKKRPNQIDHYQGAIIHYCENVIPGKVVIREFSWEIVFYGPPNNHVPGYRSECPWCKEDLTQYETYEIDWTSLPRFKKINMGDLNGHNKEDGKRL